MIHFKNHKKGFTIVEVIIAMAITALVLTPIFVMHGMILTRVTRGSTAFDVIMQCKALLLEARQKQEPDAQEFSLEKPVVELDATRRYELDKAVDQKSSLAAMTGLHRESVVMHWTRDGQKMQERLVTFVYKKPEQKQKQK
jgi:prepilin-type N-terminal cleavage/methylation domain-containing protein